MIEENTINYTDKRIEWGDYEFVETLKSNWAQYTIIGYDKCGNKYYGSIQGYANEPHFGEHTEVEIDDWKEVEPEDKSIMELINSMKELTDKLFKGGNYAS